MLYTSNKFKELLGEMESAGIEDSAWMRLRIAMWQIRALQIQAEEIERLRLEMQDITNALMHNR
jgi:uncharacterized protein YdgA (DUF945 family)